MFNPPEMTGEIQISRGLFGWHLTSGKKRIDCKSEEEARYLKVFLDSGLTEIKVPKEKEYLKSILPELEELKMKIDTIVNSYLESIVNIKTRERLRHLLWSEIVK